MRPAPLLAALSLVVSALPALAQDAAPPTSRIEHFIDFRARPGVMWGHTFIVYGRVDGRGMPLELQRAGLFPDDNQPALYLGVVPVHARVRSVAEDVTELPSAIYRRRLNAAQYAHLKTTVARMRATGQFWQMLTSNCNDFGIAIARQLGLAAPPNLLVPNAWVRALAAMNGG